MKNCSVFEKGKCLGCTGLAEWNWCGAEKCPTYKNNIEKSINECKEILGIQERIKL